MSSRAKVVPAPPPKAAFASLADDVASANAADAHSDEHDSARIRTAAAALNANARSRGSRVAFAADGADTSSESAAPVHHSLLSAPSSSSSVMRNRRASMTVSQMARLSNVKLPSEPMLGGGGPPLTVQVETIRADGSVISDADGDTAGNEESASSGGTKSRKQKYQVESRNARRANVDGDFTELAAAESTALDPVSSFRLAWTAASLAFRIALVVIAPFRFCFLDYAFQPLDAVAWALDAFFAANFALQYTRFWVADPAQGGRLLTDPAEVRARQRACAWVSLDAIYESNHYFAIISNFRPNTKKANILREQSQ